MKHLHVANCEVLLFRPLTTGMGVNDIARHLAISSKTISTHKVRLLGKLNLSSVADLMRYAMTHDLLQ